MNQKVYITNETTTNCISPDHKVRRNVRIGEYSPLNPANQINSQPFFEIGEYNIKKKKLLKVQKKEYIEYLPNEGNRTKEIKLDCNDSQNHPIQLAVEGLGEGIKSYAFDQEQIKENNRLKQERYRFELNKQIEEKKKLELERKHKEQMEDKEIERAARFQEDKAKKGFEKEVEKRTLSQLQKNIQLEKFKNEIMQKQIDLDNKLSNITPETIFQQISKETPPIHIESIECNDSEEFCSHLYNATLPTSCVQGLRKIVYDEEIEPVSLLSNTNASTNQLPIENILDYFGYYLLYGAEVSDNGLIENNHELPTDKQLLSNMGNIRKQLDIEHQKLKQQVRKSQ